MLLVLRHRPRLRDRTGAEQAPQLLRQVDEILVLEEFPRRQRQIVALGGQFVVDDPALAQRAAVHVDCAHHPVRAGVDGAVNDGSPAGVANQDHGRIERIDLRHNGVDVGAQADAGARCVGGLEARQRQRVDLVPGRDERVG